MLPVHSLQMVVPFVDPTTYINVGGPDNLASLEVRGSYITVLALVIAKRLVGSVSPHVTVLSCSKDRVQWCTHS